MDLTEPYNTNRGGRGGGPNNRSKEPREIPLGMVIDRTSRLHIKNIPLSVIESQGAEALKGDFEQYGLVDRYVLFSDKTGRFTGAGMCTFRNPADAREALKALNGRDYNNSDGSTLEVRMAQEHGVVLMRDLNKQRWERRETAMATNSDANDVEDGPGADLGARDRTRRGYHEDGSWSHDKFEQMQRGEQVRGRGGYRGPDYYARRNNINRGGRGGGRGGYHQVMDDRFEQYIQQRDSLLPVMGSTATSLHPTPPVGVAPILEGASSQQSIMAVPAAAAMMLEPTFTPSGLLPQQHQMVLGDGGVNNF